MKYISEADRRAKQMASVFGIEETVSFYLHRSTDLLHKVLGGTPPPKLLLSVPLASVVE